MSLLPIKEEQLIFSGDIEDDRTNTYLSLNDYDWMDYHLNTRFNTEEQGILEVSFQYFGMVTSRMEVKQLKNKKETHLTYEFSTDIFKKHIVNFLFDHIAAWNSTYAFNGEEQVINFFNEVLEVGTLIEEK